MGSAPATLYRLSSDVVTRDIDGGLVLVNLATGGTWKLNETGAELCRVLERGASLEEMSAALVRRFGVTAEVAGPDARRLLEALTAQGLVGPTAA